MNSLTPQDTQVLREAVARLEKQSFAMTVAAKVGMPVEGLVRLLPAPVQHKVGGAVNKALEQCLQVALAAGRGALPTAPRNRTHTLLTAATGAAGGFFGLPGMLVELPVTTTLMLHSIAEIARSHGEDLNQPDAALACLEVLALGPDGSQNDLIESAYYTTRAALAQVTRDAVAYLAQKGVAKEGTPVLVSFLAKIAARFGLEVSEKAAAQLVPVAGAVGGLALNVLFTQHFQQIAEGHFAVRALERRYGPLPVRHAYEALQASA
ncbi:EcsC protein family protein [Granulicella rosea]|uniref:EcsC protein family protein n=1 Tax=Granulicella rosea TaxID=474952 RepID=A0A239GZR1_9BACT|nr:EcsC family protein [Granulicella rosea]SNS74630.1 EcsC protein family protein [Granulicella rosea]